MGAFEDYKTRAQLTLMRADDSLQILALSCRSCNTSAILSEISWAFQSALELSLSFGELHGKRFSEEVTDIEISLARFRGENEFLRRIYDGTDEQRESLPARIVSLQNDFSEWLAELYAR
jgi:hypothetical protein